MGKGANDGERLVEFLDVVTAKYNTFDAGMLVHLAATYIAHNIHGHPDHSEFNEQQMKLMEDMRDALLRAEEKADQGA